jgi:outer membrane protein assembly factor BamB
MRYRYKGAYQFLIAIWFVFLLCKIQIRSDERPKVLWRTPISHDGDVRGLIPLTTYKSGVLCLTRNQEGPMLQMKDQNTGKQLWSWRDTAWNVSSSIHAEAIHIYQHILVLQHSSQTYHINLNNGNLIRKITNTFVSTSIAMGLKNFYCFTRYSASSCKFYTGDVRTNKQQLLTSIAISKQGESVIPQAPTFTEHNGEILLLLPFRRHNESQLQNRDQGFIMLYNFSTKRQVYSLPVSEASFYEAIHTPVVVKQKFYMTVGCSIVCHNLMIGKQLWKTKFPGDFMSSGIIYADGKIIGNCEDANMYALDPDTGKILWREKTAGTSRTPFYMNGVAYLAGNGDGLLHAVDTKIGEHLWRVICPENGDNSSFFGYVTGTNGKIFVCSDGFLYCFKAAR